MSERSPDSDRDPGADDVVPVEPGLPETMREAARELAHEMKNLLGIASGSAELLLVQFEAAARAPYSPGGSEADERRAAIAAEDDVLPTLSFGDAQGRLDWDQAHQNLARIQRSLERMSAYVSLGQQMLRRDGEAATRFDLLAELRALAKEYAPFAEDGGVALELRGELEQAWVRAPRQDSLALVRRMLRLGTGLPGALDFRAARGGRAIELRFPIRIVPGTDSNWSLPGERLRVRSWGGELRVVDGGVVLRLPAVRLVEGGRSESAETR